RLWRNSFGGRRFSARSCYLRMRSAVLSLYLGNSIPERLIVRARLGKLVINPERELPISLLQIQLRHCLLNERFLPRTGEYPGFFPWFNALVNRSAGRGRPGVESLLIIR